MHASVSYPREPDTPISHLPFSPAVRVGNLVFVSGQASVDATGKIVADSFEGEFRRSVENLRKVLQSAGCGLAQVVQTRNYVRDADDLVRFNQLYREYFSAPYPARTTITGCLSPALRFEIECIAVADDPPAAASPAGFADPAGNWNRRFGADGFLFGTEPNAWLRQHTAVWPAGSRVLCVADGEGRNSVWLAGQGLSVDAFDIAEVGVAKARRLAAEHGVSVNYAVADCDACTWPPAAYDGVAAIFVQFADPAMRERLFANIFRCLKPGGTLVLQGYTPKQLEYRTGGPAVLSHLYTETLLRQAFAKLDILELSEYEDELAEGSGHRGRSALIGLVARRR